MKDFALIYRNELSNFPSGTEEEMAAMTKRWMDWIASIANNGQLTDRGNRLEVTGRVVRSGNVTNGPYAEIKESIGGYSIIKAATYEDAIAIAQGCPIFSVGGNVEVREVSVLR